MWILHVNIIVGVGLRVGDWRGIYLLLTPSMHVVPARLDITCDVMQ